MNSVREPEADPAINTSKLLHSPSTHDLRQALADRAVRRRDPQGVDDRRDHFELASASKVIFITAMPCSIMTSI
jgi:hypothetical protein